MSTVISDVEAFTSAFLSDLLRAQLVHLTLAYSPDAPPSAPPVRQARAPLEVTAFYTFSKPGHTLYCSPHVTPEQWERSIRCSQIAPR
jgi:hypothetical protein